MGDSSRAALRHLDSAVSMLTLGRQGILQPALRSQLQEVCVATVFILSPRLVNDAADVANKHDSAAASSVEHEDDDDRLIESAAQQSDECSAVLHEPASMPDSAASAEPCGSKQPVIPRTCSLTRL